MVVMTLCPNCRTIQKAGNPCPLCKCPIHRPRARKKGCDHPPEEPCDCEPRRR